MDVSAVLLLALSETAQAHFLWLERDGDGPARAYFGEWIDDIREKTGGLLDASKHRACYSARAASNCQRSAMTTIWRSTPKGAATSWGARAWRKRK
jgi:hypothetical protein